MITEDVTLRGISAEIDEAEIVIIRAYIQGAVYTWCKNCKDENQTPRWFSARDLFGGDNYDWRGTPLFQIYEWHEQNGADDPVNMAGRDVGQLLKSVLFEDGRRFNTRENYVREYQWVIG